MRVTFIQPRVGAKPGEAYPATWKMEPLWAAALSALTPPQIERSLLDDRFEPIPVDHQTDLVAISVETYTALRAYRIAADFRARGVPVVLGGVHVTLQPEEASGHADAIVVGQAESVWPQLLEDAATGRLAGRYEASMSDRWIAPQPDRSLYAGRNYGLLRLIETSRGCVHHCEFCSIASFYRHRFAARPVAEVVEDIRRAGGRLFFFVDDNLVADPGRLRTLCDAITPLRIRWLGQIGIRVAEDETLLRALRRSGCAGVLIGFESLDSANLAAMGKPVAAGASRYEAALARLRRHGLAVYGTFVFGYDEDGPAAFAETMDFAVRNRMFFAAFNHLVPFPGTPLHARLHAAEKLLDARWWLDGNYRFGDVAFKPARMTPQELAARCATARRQFYRWGNLLRRLDFRANMNDPIKAFSFFQQNLVAAHEIERRLGLYLGA